jgi:hypothetical protein
MERSKGVDLKRRDNRREEVKMDRSMERTILCISI